MLEQPTHFRSTVSFEHDRIGAAAVYCADGRYGDQMDEFLHHHLGLPRYDRVAIPGGPACLAPHVSAMRERGALEKQLRFLIESHELTRVVLIAHEDCGFYRHLLHLRTPIQDQQFKDLLHVAGQIRSWRPGIQVDAYFARKVEGTVEFQPVIELPVSAA
jgi:Putative carbonic anhydrase